MGKTATKTESDSHKIAKADILTEGVVGHGVLGAHQRRDHLGELHVANLPGGLGDLPHLVGAAPLDQRPQAPHKVLLVPQAVALAELLGDAHIDQIRCISPKHGIISVK